MQVKDLEKIFGLDVTFLKNLGKRYRLAYMIGTILDVSVMVILLIKLITEPVYYQRDVPIYVMVAIVAAVFANLAVNSIIKDEYKQAYDFYKRKKRLTVVDRSYDVDSQKLFSILFCSGYKKVSPDKDIDVYIDLMYNACCQNIKYASRMMKYLSRYEVKDGNFKAQIAVGGNREYFLNKKED